MTDIDSGHNLIYRILTVQITPVGAQFGLSVGYYPTETPTVWLEQSQKWLAISAEDVATVMGGTPEVGLTRREDISKAWAQYFIDHGLISGTLVPSL